MVSGGTVSTLLLVALGGLLLVLYITREQLRELRDSITQIRDDAAELVELLGGRIAALEDMARTEELHGYAPNRGRVHVRRGQMTTSKDGDQQ